MNYKFLFPTYRDRFFFVKECLDTLAKRRPIVRVLNIGTGEGDYDATLAEYAKEVQSCDINSSDITRARELNADVQNLQYSVQDATATNFEPESFDVIVCIDVIEHVASPHELVKEVSRLLKKDGYLILSFPNRRFPWTYDPVNAVLGIFRRKILGLGAYGFGHSWLPSRAEVTKWLADRHFSIEREQNLTTSFSALFEMYWVGFAQKFFKANASNSLDNRRERSLKPSRGFPPFVSVLARLSKAESRLFGVSSRSVGVGLMIRKDSRD